MKGDEGALQNRAAGGDQAAWAWKAMTKLSR